MSTADQEVGSAGQEDGFREIKIELTIYRQKYYRNNSFVACTAKQ